MDKFIIKEIKKKITIKQVGSPCPRGEDGDPGLSATIAIGSVTSGNIPSVTNVGTENDAVFDFVLAKGDKGDNGDSSTLQNVGDGVGVWKDTVGSIASLKTIRSGSDILLLVDNDIDNTIDFNIDTRELNNVINNSLTGINEELTLIEEHLTNIDLDINTINTSIGNINTEIETINTTLTSHSNSITSNTNAISSLNTQITSINNSITAINSKLVPVGGTTGQVLAKKSNTDYDTQWVTQSSGGGTLDPFNKFTRRRYIYSIGNFQNSQINIATMGFGNSSTNYQFNSGVPVSFVNGKGAFYQYSKFTYKDPTATGTSTTGYICGSVYADTINFLGYGDALFKFGLTSVNDPSCAMFVGLSSGNNSLPTTANDIFNNSFGGGAWAIGFGFEGTDTNLQFFFIRSGNYKYKVNFNQFTGNYIASDILAKQAETAISYRMTNKLDSNNVVIGIDLEFYNHNTNRGGKYSLLFSQLNQTHMFIKDQVSFSPLWGFWQNPGFTGVKDIFNLFIVDITN